MAFCQKYVALLSGVILAASSVAGQSTVRQGYDVNYIGAPLADPVLQHSKETYVLFGCSYCHGLNLMTRGEATDLMHSRLVGRDENGNIIGPLLRAGIPQTAKLSPMPQFSDLSGQQIADLVRWIHYARQQGRYKELVEDKALYSGTAEAGKSLFDQKCGACHSAQGDLADISTKYDGAALKAQILRPARLGSAPSWQIERLKETKTAEARSRHLWLLENYTSQEIADLIAYLRSPH
jgi:mono/diheme cytochrome c family protein